MEPKRGDIALCSRGAKGLITSEEPELKRFQNGVEQLVWMGIYIEDFEEKRIGDPWYSQYPKVIDSQTIDALRALHGAASAVYDNDDAFVNHEDYEAVVRRDNKLGTALDFAKTILRKK